MAPRRMGLILSLIVASLSLTMWACGEDEDPVSCEGPELRPHLSPVSFGELYPLGSNEENRATNERVPYEWTLQLLSMCQKDVTISKICMVGDTSDGSNVIFSFEQPPAMTSTAADSATVRVTYERATPNEADEIDSVALIVRSNDKAFPTMVIPICARVVADGATKKTVECEDVIGEGVDPASLCP